MRPNGTSLHATVRNVCSSFTAQPSALSTASSSRSFSTTIRTQTTAAQQVQARFGKLPPYPYGPRLWYKKSNFGLFGTARVRFGNNVSEQNEHKSRRRWYPNVQRRRLWSVGLGRFVRVKVTTRVLRSVDKVGGLDEYLLGEKAGRVKELGPGGWALRWRLMRSDAVRDRYRRQCEELGVDVPLHLIPTAAEGVAIVPEEDVGMTAEQLQQREAAIDRALDMDAERDAKGEDGGVELEELEGVEAPSTPNDRKRW